MQRISIITPTYNCFQFVDRAYQNICIQDYVNWEWIVVNDGSTDETHSYFTKLEDKRIKYHYYKNNKGRAYARKKALDLATGDIIVIWDIDDLYFENRLSTICKYIIEFDYFVSPAVLIDNNFNIKGLRDYIKLNYMTVFVHPTLAFKSYLKEKIDYAEHMFIGEDMQTEVLLTNNYKGYFHDYPTMFYFEDREVTIRKAYFSNLYSFETLLKMIKNKQLNLTLVKTASMFSKYSLKLIVLSFLRLFPDKVYQYTVRFRIKKDVSSSFEVYEKILNDLKLKFSKIST